MSVTRDTSHSPIGPSAFGHTPTDEARKHVSTAALSSALVFGAECTNGKFQPMCEVYAEVRGNETQGVGISEGVRVGIVEW